MLVKTSFLAFGVIMSTPIPNKGVNKENPDLNLKVIFLGSLVESLRKATLPPLILSIKS